ncbi:hypothetical protein AN391_00521 [Pseudoalteromonas sp. P1-13-1a]|uniref:Uncharacterized protein n=1 Tax=Pseudoalteromonas undina TaxID=43660 RepID=A0ACC6R0L3_9GAMM|nr:MULTISPECIES: hypothetical protein [Pseudoalteromonas]KPZ60113.1 hypothetical protein AN391_00521 [Pseudoalteromonas sp. P1-13-1a]MCQ8888816.1 hypothetical protein [Pseudoalteromonas carrageenovora]
MNLGIGWLRKFFVNYLWLGVVIVLISIIIDVHYPDKGFFLPILVSLLNSIGIAILIASIFTFASGTSQFVDKIKGLLEDIIIKRNFLGNIDSEGKKEALKSLIQPTISESSKYPNIGDYYGHFINKTLEIGTKSVRSNYQIAARVFIDEIQSRLAISSVYSYRVYPSSDGFQRITIGFQEGLTGPSQCHHVAISTPDGKRKLIDKFTFEEKNDGGDISKITYVNTDDFDEQPHLDVELKITEYGSDHWALIDFKALQPTDGFKFILHCADDIEVQEHCIFVVGANYYLDISDDKKEISINCNQWINEGSGLTVLVSDPQDQKQNQSSLSTLGKTA